MNEEIEETIELTEDYSAIAQLDERDKRVKEAVVAYLMWHSGEILDKKKYPNLKDRALKIDELGMQAIQRHPVKEAILSDRRRIQSAKSLFTQAESSMDSDSSVIVCYLDATLLESGDVVPLLNLDATDFDLELPTEMKEIGFKFKDYNAFRQKYREFGVYLTTDPMTVMHMLEHLQMLFLYLAIPNLRERSTFHTIVPYWNIVGAPDRCEKSFENLSFTHDTGKTIKIVGQVTEYADELVVFTKIAYRCISIDADTGKKCLELTLVDQNSEEGVIQKPTECKQCKGKDFKKEDSEKSHLIPVQRIQLQELDLSEDPKSIMVELRGNLIKQALAGMTVEITGILRLEAISKNSLMSNKYILAQSVTVVGDQEHALLLSEHDEEEIRALVDTMSFRERIDYLIWSFSGHLICDPLLKRALFLQAIGAPTNSKFGHRSGIHILLAGDPGTVKTHLLRAQAKLVKGSRMVSAEAATQSGLVAAAQPIEDLYTGKKRWALHPGALALTPKEAVCCVDELNLYKGDFGDFNNALETGEVHITKVVQGKVATPCSVLAAANPVAGSKKKFVIGQSYTMQMGLDVTLQQRFDAIFIILDVADESKDEQIALSVMGYLSETKDPIEPEFIRKYIAMAKTYNPELEQDAKEYIAKEHAKKRQRTKYEDYMRSHRQVPSLVRFAQAAARFDLSPVATIEHVKIAEEILSITLNETDPGQLAGDVSQADRDIRKTVARVFVGYIQTNKHYENIDYRQVLDYSKEQGEDIDGERIKALLKAFGKNKQTGVRAHKDGSFSYNGSMNPAYEMW